jgi:hypothetical protein
MNYLSRPHGIQQPTEMGGSLQLAMSVANTLQSRYDANKAIVDQTLSQYESLRGLNETDNAYIAAQVSNIKNQINSLGSINLSYNTGRDTILNNMKNVLADPIVQDILVSKANVENVHAQFNEIAKKDPSKATQENLQYAMDEGGYYDYMQGKVKKVGSMTYRPYSDYKKKVNDSIKELESLSKEAVIEVPDPNNPGALIKTTIKNLSPEQVRQVAEASLDQHDRKQIEIDAWSNSDRFQNTAIIERANKFATDILEKSKVSVAELESKLSKGGTDKQKAEWNFKLSQAKSSQRKAEYALTSPKIATTLFQEEVTMNEAVMKWGSIYSVSREYKVDEVYENERSFNLKQMEYDLKVSEFKYKVQKDATDKADKEDADGSVTGKGRVQTITGKTITDEDLPSIEAQMDDKIAKGLETLTPISAGYKSKLEEIAGGSTALAKDAKIIMDAYKINLKRKNKNETDLDVFNRTILGKVTYGSPLAIIDSNPYLAKLRDAYDSYERDVKVKTVSNKIVEKELVGSTIDRQETYQKFFTDKDTKMLWYANGKPTAAPVYKVLQSVGLMDEKGNKIAGKVLTDPKYKDVLNALKKSYYADDILSGNAKSSDKSLQKLAAVFGEKAEDVISQIRRVDPNTHKIVPIYDINPNTEAGKYLLAAKKQGIRDRGGLTDNSLSDDDTTTNRFVREDYKPSEAYKANLQNYVDKLPENTVVSIPTTNKELHQDIGSYASGYAEAEGGTFTYDTGQGINIRVLDDDYVEVGQNIVKGQRQGQQKIKILKKDLYDNYPDLARKVDFEGKISKYNIDNIAGKKFVSAPVEYFRDTQTSQYNYANDVLFADIADQGVRMKKSVFLNASDTSQYLNSIMSNYKQKVPEIANLITKIVKSSGDYAINMESVKGFNGNELQLKLVETSSGDVIDVMTYKNGKNVDISKLKQEIDNTPQTIYGEFVERILKKQEAAAAYDSFDESFERMVNSLN